MFRNLLGQKRTLVHDAIDEVIKMLERAEGMFGVACGKLLEEGGDVDIGQSDEDINVGERMVRRMVFQHIMVNPQQDLPAGLSLISIVHDVERIGDYAKNILDLARHEHSLNEEEQELVSRLAAKASEMLRQAANLFASQNEASAAAFLEEELDLRHQCESTIDKWIDDADRNHSAACLVTRFIKRVVGHAGNVVSSVVMPLDKLDFHPGGGGDED